MIYFCSNFFLFNSCKVTGFEVANFVVEVIGVIATVAAVIVALVANKKATDSLKLSLKIQEQSKNVDLYEKRLALFEKIKSKTNLSHHTEVNLLFDKKITECYECMIAYRKKQHENNKNKMLSENFAKEIVREQGLEDFKTKIIEFKSKMSYPDCPDSVFDEYKAYCDKFEVVRSFSGLDDDLKTYNYYKYEELEDKYRCLADEEQAKLLELIEKFIKKSISPIDDD